MVAMKKTFYYNYNLAKHEEEFEPTPKATNPLGVDRSLVEIRDIFPPSISPVYNSWKIEKWLAYDKISTGKLVLTEDDTLEHVFRYWALEKCNQVLMGNKVCAVLYDVTVEEKPIVHGPSDDNTALDNGMHCFFLRVDKGLLTGRGVCPGIKINL